MVRKGLKPS
jgi:hypothetical protein